ncbi:mevalonate kinase-like [Camponotus floridanus]|uniref:mevalonate kinase-like n=1 Tax=Camponotus floridanus TaxID=104421 RepID=UPI000DC68B52|nr:mevalonate kinase-like [Camponotus floridanus]
MIKFKVSAPGKMILCGEHVMMYGKHVVAASLDLRTTLKFIELIDDPRNIIKIEFPDVNLSLNLSLELILNFFFTDNFLPLIEDDIELYKYVQYFITLNGLWRTYQQRYSLQIFLFLFLHIAHQEQLDIKSFHVHLATQLPINAGFGSSTSFAICLAACFLHWSYLQKGTHNDFDDYELEKIMLYVTTCEKIVPNYMFGIDNNVCIYGQVLKAQYQNPLNCNVKLLQVPRIKILLIDSRIRQNKFEQMMRMAQMKRSDPDESDYFLRTIDKISKRTCTRLVAINNSQNNNNLQQLYDSYRLLGISILSNQTILYRSGLSHPELDTICLIARNYGFVGKLTGFDGYAYIPLPPNTPRENIINISRHLIMEGFTVRMTSVSCNGVKLDEV